MDYMPTKDSDKVIWNTNLIAKLESEGKDVGLTPDEIADLVSTCEKSNVAIMENDSAHTAAKTAREAKDAQVKSGEKDIREVIRSVKANKNYTPTLGRSWGIIGEDPVVDYSKYHPKIKATVMPGRVKIEFVKDKLNGVTIYSRMIGQVTWVKLSYDSYSPYVDTRPLAVPGVPETREYMAIGVIRDEEVTLQSNIIEAIYGG